MLSVISKEEYWNWCDAGVVTGGRGTLKDLQDTFVLYHLKDMKDGRVCEIGGGESRLLPRLAAANECWNVDKFEGEGGGPTVTVAQPGVGIVQAYMGDFSPELPEAYFDVVFSVSVVQHVSAGLYEPLVRDCVRVLRPGGVMLHAIDVYLLDREDETGPRYYLRGRLDLYLKTAELGQGRLAWLADPAISRDVAASARHAYNNVDELHQWNKLEPDLRALRERAASCSLQMILERTS